MQNNLEGEEVKPAVNQRGFNRKRQVRNQVFIVNITDESESDRRVSVRKFPRAHSVSTKTIHVMLQKDLNLTKKSARWVLKLPNDDMKKEQVRASEEFLVLV